MQNIAVILAGGTGSRFGGDTPKQFLKNNGVSILHLAVNAFAEIEDISKIIVVSIEAYISHVRGFFKEYKNVYVISGGKTRTESSFNALKFIYKQGWEDSYVLIHDAARPFISTESITNVINAVKQYDAALLAVQSSNTLYYGKDSIITSVLNRDEVFQAQTPQAFHFKIIFGCYNRMSEGEHFTDDASVLLKYSDVPIHIVQGSLSNSKITYKGDLGPEI